MTIFHVFEINVTTLVSAVKMSHSVILKENMKMLSVVIQKNGKTLSGGIDKDATVQ